MKAREGTQSAAPIKSSVNTCGYWFIARNYDSGISCCEAREHRKASMEPDIDMKHQTCVESKVAERYLIGELPPAEREAFEQHYFECEDCAEDVRLGSSFAFE